MSICVLVQSHEDWCSAMADYRNLMLACKSPGAVIIISLISDFLRTSARTAWSLFKNIICPCEYCVALEEGVHVLPDEGNADLTWEIA